MQQAFAYIKSHKGFTFLIGGIALLFVFSFVVNSFSGVNVSRYKLASPNSSYMVPEMAPLADYDVGVAPSSATSTSERMVTEDSSLSLLVDDVRESGEKVLSYTKDAGGFMVSSTYNQPIEEPFATIVVRIPNDKLDEALGLFRGMAVKVTNENLMGTDITEQYQDVDERIAILERTKSRFEGLMDSAIDFSDIVTINRELVSIQSQIDSLVGQKEAMENEVRYSRVTVFLSTDELALPYTPDESFRPKVVFKLAVRSLLNALRVVGEAGIWVLVYSVLWLPVLGVVFIYRKLKRRKAL